MDGSDAERFNPLYNPLTVSKLQCAARWNFLSAHLNGSTAGRSNLVPMDAESASSDSPQQMRVERQGRERRTSNIYKFEEWRHTVTSATFRDHSSHSGQIQDQG